MTGGATPGQLDLAGFSGPELTILAHHLHYAAGRLRQEMETLRQAGRRRTLYPHRASGKTKAQGLLISHSHGEATLWAGLLRDHRYFTALARAVEGLLADPWASLFIPAYQRPPLDLSNLLSEDNQYLHRFLTRERYRSQLAVDYIRRETFDEGVKQDLLLALDVEIRFFNCLLAWLEPLLPPSHPVAGPAEDRVPLLFVSLPRILTSGQARTIHQNPLSGSERS